MEARRQAMIDAAAEIIFEVGYERASLAAIVRRSGGSLTTLYQLFGNKDGLLEAMVEQRCTCILEALSSPDLSARGPRIALISIAHAFMRVLLSPEAQLLWRMVVSEGLQFPRLPQIFFSSGPDRLHARLAEYLQGLDQTGCARVSDPLAAAKAFCMLVHGDLHNRVVSGLRPVPDAAELAAHIEQAVDMFACIIQLAPAGTKPYSES
jgi:AcrR family transcriptional regulator